MTDRPGNPDGLQPVEHKTPEPRVDTLKLRRAGVPANRTQIPKGTRIRKKGTGASRQGVTGANGAGALR